MAEFWKEQLGLQTYAFHMIITSNMKDVDLITTMEQADAASGYVQGQSSTDAGTRSAEVRIHPLVFEDPDYSKLEDISGLVAHELMHVVFHDETGPLIEEMANVLKGPDVVRGSYMKRAYDVQERMVRILEQVFMKVPLPEKIKRLAA